MVLRNMGPRRLWSTGSAPKSSSKKKVEKMPYPNQIVVDEEQMQRDLEKEELKMQRDLEREEVKFWKEKALKLEEAVEIMEDIVTLSEKQQQQQSEVDEHGSGKKAARAHSASSTASSTPPPSPEKNKVISQRKDEIVQQLVSEMERIIETHTAKNVPAKYDGDSNDTSNDGTDPQTKKTTIDTSELEKLVTQALDLDKDESTKKSKAKTHKHKNKQKEPKRVLYQLSCKKCIGKNFVGTTKSDLPGKVKEHYAVVWNMVQTAYGKGEGFIEGSDHEHSLAFRASSFSHHIVGHCKDCQSEEEAYQWCLKNVKVERISRGLP